MLSTQEGPPQQISLIRDEVLLCVTSLIWSPISFFPNSLRFLVQQHVDLLHALQERVLSWPRQGILGDIFLKLTNDEVCVKDLSRIFCHVSLHSVEVQVDQDTLNRGAVLCSCGLKGKAFQKCVWSTVLGHGSPSGVQGSHMPDPPVGKQPHSTAS